MGHNWIQLVQPPTSMLCFISSMMHSCDMPNSFVTFQRALLAIPLDRILSAFSSPVV
jgi:hypothetical protein